MNELDGIPLISTAVASMTATPVSGVPPVSSRPETPPLHESELAVSLALSLSTEPLGQSWGRAALLQPVQRSERRFLAGGVGVGEAFSSECLKPSESSPVGPVFSACH